MLERRDIQRYYPAPKREKPVFLFVVKGILGQRYYESDYCPDLARLFSEIKPQPIQSKKGRGNSSSIGGRLAELLAK